MSDFQIIARAFPIILIAFFFGFFLAFFLIACPEDVRHVIARVKNVFWRCAATGCSHRMNTEWVDGSRTFWECFGHSEERRAGRRT